MKTMNLEYLTKDPVFEEGQKPFSISTLIKGQLGNILSLMYMPGGQGPHPAVLLCHGYPGTERNLDIAQALRRIGFAVMTFHYAGSWNSEGDFSLSGCIRDAETVLDAMIENASEWGIDPASIAIVGHSMGGMVTANLLAKRAELKRGVMIAPWDAGRMYLRKDLDEECDKNLKEVLDCGYGWLRGISPEKFEEDLREHAGEIAFEGLCPRLVRKDLLCIAGGLDEDVPMALHAGPFKAAMEAAQAGTATQPASQAAQTTDQPAQPTSQAAQTKPASFTYRVLDSDHSFSDMRISLIRCVAEYLALE